MFFIGQVLFAYQMSTCSSVYKQYSTTLQKPTKFYMISKPYNESWKTPTNAYSQIKHTEMYLLMFPYENLTSYFFIAKELELKKHKKRYGCALLI